MLALMNLNPGIQFGRGVGMQMLTKPKRFESSAKHLHKTKFFTVHSIFGLLEQMHPPW
jgi:hypothetical protein